MATDALAIAGAASAAAKILGFRAGGIATGPSHEQGGIPLYHQGRPAGIEIEGGEPVLTRGVSQNPLLLSMASAVNQMAGGRALGPAAPVFPRFNLGGLTPTLAREQLRGQVQVVSPAALGEAVAVALRKNPPVNKWVDFQHASDRAAFTQEISNS